MWNRVGDELILVLSHVCNVKTKLARARPARARAR